MPSTVLIVDDEPLNLTVLSRILMPACRVLVARDGPSALALAERELPDLILLDVMMPGMDGHTVLSRLKASAALAAIPVIFVTGLGTPQHEEQGLAEGAVDYIVKPVEPSIVLARVQAHLALKHARDHLAQHNAWLEHEVRRRVDEAMLACDLSLVMLAELAEARDSDTGNHILRTQGYIEALVQALQDDPAYAPQLGDAQVRHIVQGAPLHDIGKIAIRDELLLKPGALTAQEMAVMRTHAVRGSTVIDRAIRKVLGEHPSPGATDEDELPEAVRQLQVAHDIARHHHERWDGTGYPDGLSGAAIPLPARLMAVADVFDALSAQRVYKPAWTLPRTQAYIVEQAGASFDPGIVAAFERARPRFEALAHELAD